MACAAMMKGIIVVLIATGIPCIFACEGVWDCVRTDIASNLTSILASDTWNLTRDGRIVIERVRDSDVPVKRIAPDAGFFRLIQDSIKVFETHQLLWQAVPGYVDVKIFKHEGEGMDFGIDVPSSSDGRTWRVGAMRRRITMALLPIMYKLGVSTTLLGVLVFIGLKTAAMVSVLFVLALGSLAKHKLGVLTGHSSAPAHWSPAPPPSPVLPVQKEVHVHVHADPHKQTDHQWIRRPPIDDYDGPGASDHFSGPPYPYGGGSGYGAPYDDPQLIYRASLRRWLASRPSTVRPGSSWSPSQALLTGTLPASAYAMSPRWSWHRYMDQEELLDSPKHSEKSKRSDKSKRNENVVQYLTH